MVSSGIPLLTRRRYGRNVTKPLTRRTEGRLEQMTVELLRYANRQAVAKRLTDDGYSVTRQTVNRWARGDEMPSIAQRMILELFGHDPSRPGTWQQRVLAGTMALEKKARVTDDELDAAEAEAAAYLALARQTPPVQGDDDARPD